MNFKDLTYEFKENLKTTVATSDIRALASKFIEIQNRHATQTQIFGHLICTSRFLKSLESADRESLSCLPNLKLEQANDKLPWKNKNPEETAKNVENFLRKSGCPKWVRNYYIKHTFPAYCSYNVFTTGLNLGREIINATSDPGLKSELVASFIISNSSFINFWEETIFKVYKPISKERGIDYKKLVYIALEISISELHGEELDAFELLDDSGKETVCKILLDTVCSQFACLPINIYETNLHNFSSCDPLEFVKIMNKASMNIEGLNEINYYNKKDHPYHVYTELDIAILTNSEIKDYAESASNTIAAEYVPEGLKEINLDLLITRRTKAEALYQMLTAPLPQLEQVLTAQNLCLLDVLQTISFTQGDASGLALEAAKIFDLASFLKSYEMGEAEPHALDRNDFLFFKQFSVLPSIAAVVGIRNTAIVAAGLQSLLADDTLSADASSLQADMFINQCSREPLECSIDVVDGPLVARSAFLVLRVILSSQPSDWVYEDWSRLLLSVEGRKEYGDSEKPVDVYRGILSKAISEVAVKAAFFFPYQQREYLSDKTTKNSFLHRFEMEMNEIYE